MRVKIFEDWVVIDTLELCWALQGPGQLAGAAEMRVCHALQWFKTPRNVAVEADPVM